MQSIIQKDRECYLCHTTLQLQEHHIIHGTANRKKSEQYGLKIWLCMKHHTGSNGSVHQDSELDLKIKQLAQRRFEESHDRSEFIKEFGKSFL